MSAPQFLLYNSDHLAISLQVKRNVIINYIQIHIRVNKRIIWRYAPAEFDSACTSELIDMLEMDSIIDSNSVEKSWSNWKGTIMSIMEEGVPKAPIT